MSERPPNPERVDLRGLARQGGELHGIDTQQRFARLHASVEASGDVAPEVSWSARGELRPVTGGEPQVWLHLRAETSVRLVCQRCLQAMSVPLSVQRSFRFVVGEAEAERLDEESEDDVLALPARFDLMLLVEDELILAMPLVPRHETCPDPLPLPSDDLQAPDEEEAPHPFAALAALRRPPRPN